MDLNDLFARHQLSLVRAGEASSADARAAHRGLATGYADRIRTFQQAIGAGFPLAEGLR